MKRVIMVTAIILLPFVAASQENKIWTEEDRNYLAENLVRTREELMKETEGLSDQQWKFKEAPDRWSINEVVEHIHIWEMLLMYDVTRSLSAGIQPTLLTTAKHDDVILGFITEETPHHSLEYTKPFNYTIPMGINDLKNNVALFLKLRDQSIQYIKTSKEDLRLYARTHDKSTSIHQLYIVVFGHTDRHLRQIRKIKKHINYPHS